MRKTAILSLLMLLAPAAAFAGPGPTAAEIAAHPPLRLDAYPTQTSSPSKTLMSAIGVETKKRSKLVYRGKWKGETASLPDDVCASQIAETYGWGSITFVFVLQPDSNMKHAEQEACSGRESVDVAGVLATTNGGKTWETLFSIPVPEDESLLPQEELCRWSFSPIALFTDPRGRLFIDLKDANLCGAGSGEGDFIRFASADRGQTWTWNACYYFIPESYYRFPKGEYDRFSLAKSFSLTKLRRMNTRWSPQMPLTDCPYGAWPGYWASLEAGR